MKGQREGQKQSQRDLPLTGLHLSGCHRVAAVEAPDGEERLDTQPLTAQTVTCG